VLEEKIKGLTILGLERYPSGWAQKGKLRIHHLVFTTSFAF
jgi:hypothetical protein